MSGQPAAQGATPGEQAASTSLFASLFGQCCKAPGVEGELKFDDLEKKERKKDKKEKKARKQSRGPSGEAAASGVGAGAQRASSSQGSNVYRYLIDNSVLQIENRPGVAFRHTKRAEDKVRTEKGPAKWGEVVEGVDEGDGWLRVGNYYLPMMHQGVPVVTLVADGDSQASRAANNKPRVDEQVRAPATPVSNGAPVARGDAPPAEPQRKAPSPEKPATQQAKSPETGSFASPSQEVAEKRVGGTSPAQVKWVTGPTSPAPKETAQAPVSPDAAAGPAKPSVGKAGRSPAEEHQGSAGGKPSAKSASFNPVATATQDAAAGSKDIVSPQKKGADIAFEWEEKPITVVSDGPGLHDGLGKTSEEKPAAVSGEKGLIGGASIEEKPAAVSSEKGAIGGAAIEEAPRAWNKMASVGTWLQVLPEVVDDGSAEVEAATVFNEDTSLKSQLEWRHLPSVGTWQFQQHVHVQFGPVVLAGK